MISSPHDDTFLILGKITEKGRKIIELRVCGERKIKKKAEVFGLPFSEPTHLPFCFDTITNAEDYLIARCPFGGKID